MKPLRVALFYNHEPSGHAQAAAAIEQELAARQPGAQVLRVALSGEMHPVIGPVIAKTYLSIATALPSLWDYLYDNAAVADAAEGLLELLRRREGERIRSFLRAARPDVVVATQALPCNVLAAERRAGRVGAPLIGVPTDFVAHRYWIARGVDLFLAPSEDTRDDLRRRGVSAESIRVTGIPIAPAFAAPRSREAARHALRLDPGRATVLLTGGTKALGGLEEAAAALARLRRAPQVLVSCGANAALQRRLRRLALPRTHLYKGLEGRMPELMAAADLLVGKPGGVTSAEALALGLPMLLYGALPGQEEHNARFLVRHGAALRAGDLGELARAAERLLGEDALRAKLSAAARRLGRPDSAARACDAVLQAAGRGQQLEAKV